MKIAFFTEAGFNIGMGHLVRLYTIYKVFKKNNHKVYFFLDSNIKYDINNIIYFNWNNLKINEFYDIIFIDSYIADLKIYNYLFNKTSLLVCLDDYGRLNYPKGLVINFSLDANRYFINNKYLLGIKYLPLRDDLINIKKVKPLNNKAIFIMLGGYDIKNLSIDIIKILNNLYIKKYIVINKRDVLLKLKKYKNCHILYKPSDKTLFKYMAKSSLAITTASMVVYELAYLQIPVISVSVAKNQDIGVYNLLKNKLIVSYIRLNYNWKNKLLYNVKKYLDYKINKSIIDKNGKNRIYKKVIKYV